MYDFLSPNKTNRDWKRGHEAMSQQILQVDQAMLETTLDRMVRKSVEETLNAMLDAEADEITGAARYERSGERKAYRAGHYERDLTVKAGKMSLKVPKLKGAVFESAVIERYRRREESVEEALIDMYLAGVSTRQVDDVSQLLWGDRMPSQTLSDKLKKVYADIDEWRGRPLEQDYPYLFMDGVWHKRCWGGSVENVSILVAVGVGMDGRREVLSVAEGMKEDSESWREFIKGMLARGLKGVRLVTGDRCAGLVAAVNELLPGARYQRCMVHFERNILAKVNPKNRDWAADALKAIFSMESRDKALEKAESVAKDMEARKLREAAKCLREGIGETTTYLLDDYPREHRRRIRTNNMIERLNREIRRRTRVVGSFPDGRSALMLICARVRYVTSSEWSTRRYLDMSRLGENVQSAN
ncbi:Transposase [Bifidobacterium longum E18]|nr:transposase [Bifidobacterium longum subsp. longum KACC 91563]ESV34244.1 Transposase [Bifidobacterium longum E18]AEI96984.1 transposase [Bifidobacterium longum subsp. longum KACC 91563]AEI97607.1 transposase [Bifidobacterium longum subsp. longum KACC 91563]AEI97718.1 transposase [Bifidobacterium longum subsp. longum KACC 91563]